MSSLCASLALLLVQLPVRAHEELQTLVLPADLPARFETTLMLAGEPRRARLERRSLRAADAQCLVYGPEGAYTSAALPPVRTYRGWLEGEEERALVASLEADGLHASVLGPTGEEWRLAPSAGGLHRLTPVSSLAAGPLGEGACGAELPAAPLLALGAPLGGGGRVRAAPGPATCLTRCELAFDADHDYYQLKGSSVPNVIAAIEAHLNLVEFFYARDVQITYAVSAFVVRTAPFYNPSSAGDLLDQFRLEWSTQLSGVPRDVAHLMTDVDQALLGNIIGLAYVGVMCSQTFGYGWSKDSANVLGHELGHNWGAGHCHDLSPCNTMCGGCFLVAPETKDIIAATRDSAPCLERVGLHPDPLPPYAHPDELVLAKPELVALGARAFDVLVNDHDANCDPLRIAAFDALTPQGGTVVLSPQGGPQARDELVYTPPAVPFVGSDTIHYTVRDPRGLSAVGTLTIESRAADLEGYWRLDELSGTLVADATPRGHDGLTSGAPVWSSGQRAGALVFDGFDDQVTLPALALDTARATFTAWVWRDGAQPAWAGLIFTRGGSTLSGLNFGTNNGLRYHWNGDPASYGWNPGLGQLPDRQWVFSALVVEPGSATLYVHDGTWKSATNVRAHAREAFDAPTLLGQDPAGGRFFRGRLDDVRIYGTALSFAELEEVRANGGPAGAPWPVDGGRVLRADAPLAWATGPEVLNHELYFGSDYQAVRDALPGGPQYRGFVGGTSYVPGALAHDTLYFWRLDSHLAGGVTPGAVWQFRLADFGHWRLDEGAGATALDSEGGTNGSYVNGPQLGQPGATPGLGSSVRLDGVNDVVTLPPLQLDSASVTLTTWLRRDGPQSAWAGLVFSRAQSTVAGLSLGNAHELRYTWNGDGGTWGFDSGLVVPDNAWVFAAMVVEPTRATLYLGQNGVLTAAVNALTHGPEEFDGQTRFGHDQGFSSRRFKGWLDDVRIYDAALTPAEVSELYLGSL